MVAAQRAGVAPGRAAHPLRAEPDRARPAPTGAPTDLDLDVVIAAARAGGPAEDAVRVPRLRRRRDWPGSWSASPHDPIDDRRRLRRLPAQRRPGRWPCCEPRASTGPTPSPSGPAATPGVIETTEHGGYPVFDHLKMILGGPVVWAPAVDGAVVLSQRGGDFELVARPGLLHRLRGAPTATAWPSTSRRAWPCASAPPRPRCASPIPDRGALAGLRSCRSGPVDPYRVWSPWRRRSAAPSRAPDSTEQRPARAHVLTQSQRDPARLARHRRRRPRARSRRHRGGPHPAGQAQADLHAPHRHRRPRDHHQRRQDRAHRGQGRQEADPPPLGLSRAASASAPSATSWTRRPAEAVRRSIRGMLPKTRLGRAQISKLKIYAGPTHPHAAQKPQPLALEHARARS